MCLGNCTLADSVMTLWVVVPSLDMLHLAESAFSTRSTKDTVPTAFASQASDSVHDTSLGALCPNICSRFLFGPGMTEGETCLSCIQNFQSMCLLD